MRVAPRAAVTLAALFALALATACDGDLSGGVGDARGARADSGTAAEAGLLEAGLPDAALADAGASEAGTPDSGQPDAPRDGAIPRDTTTPPRDTTAPPRDTTTPPRDTTAPPRDTTAPPRDTGSTTCAARALLTALGRTRLLVGASMSDAIASSTPFDLRYLYLAGGLFDGSAPCSSCASGCTASGTTCANSGPGCAWWGCWQWDQQPPGKYVRDFIAKAQGDGQIPMITTYQIRSMTPNEGADEVRLAATNVAKMTRYFADWRFVLQQVANQPVVLHIEPDFWGYAQQLASDPTTLPAAVASANPTDCAAQPNTIAGMGRCMVAMVRKYAPNAKVGLHASAWATKVDVSLNTNTSLDVAAHARAVADFLLAAGGAQSDLVVVEASDRDAGWYQTVANQNRWWDATNATLPSFDQHFAWAKALSERAQKPLVWWQLPVGNMALPNTTAKWKDNRVEYFFSHTQQIADAHGIGFAFGAGAGGQTTPSSDNGNLVAKVRAYKTAGGQAPTCP